MKNYIASFLTFGLLLTTLLSATHQDKRPIRAVNGGYMLEFAEPTFDKAATEGTVVDVALVDFTLLAKAKNAEDSTAILGKIYSNPSLFSIVTGKLSYQSASSAMLVTKAKFKVNILDGKYGLVVAENDGNDNSGALSPSPKMYSINGGKCTCTGRPCGCCCIRKANGNCLTCAIRIKL